LDNNANSKRNEQNKKKHQQDTTMNEQTPFRKTNKTVR